MLFCLGTDLTLGQCVGRWKFVARQAAEYREDWQRDFWEHRLWERESREDYALYMFLNPYRAALVPSEKRWPWWWTPDPQMFQFSGQLSASGGPPPEWIGWSDERFAALRLGE